MKEALVKKRVKDLLIKLDIWYYMPIPYGRIGIADFVCCVDGHFLMIETKGKGGRQSAAQKFIEEAFTAHGGTYWLVRPQDLDDLETRLEAFKNEQRKTD